MKKILFSFFFLFSFYASVFAQFGGGGNPCGMASLAEQRKDLLNSMMKDGIYEAAVEVLNKHGSDGLTMDRLAETAGIAKGSLYNYFRNKHELIVFIYTRTIEPISNAIDDVIAKLIPADAKLSIIVSSIVENFSTHRGIFDFLFNDLEVKAVVETLKRDTSRSGIIAQLTAVFEQGAAEGSFRKLVPSRTAEMVFGTITGMLEQELIAGENRSPKESADLLLDLMLKGLEPRA